MSSQLLSNILYNDYKIKMSIKINMKSKKKSFYPKKDLPKFFD